MLPVFLCTFMLHNAIRHLIVGKSDEGELCLEEAEIRVSKRLLELLISLVCLYAQGELVKQDKII